MVPNNEKSNRYKKPNFYRKINFPTLEPCASVSNNAWNFPSDYTMACIEIFL